MHLTTPTFLTLLLASTPLLTSANRLSGSGSHDRPIARRHHHAKIARSAQNADVPVFEKREEGGKAGLRIKKRGDGKVCRIRSGGNNSTAAASAAASATDSNSASIAAALASNTASLNNALAGAPTAATSLPSSAVYQTPTTTSDAPQSTSTTSSSAAATTSASSGGGGQIGQSGLTPNGKKAGIAGGDSYGWVQNHIGWWYDWSAEPSGHSGTNPLPVNMLWGAGVADGTDASRLVAFKALSYTPKYVIGYEEPDCFGSGSAGFDVDTGVALWNSVVAPLGEKGSVLLSPSMCHQAAETGWLGPFRSKISRDWDVTNIHVNKNNMAGVKADIDHYWNTYGKPIWVTEFACVDDSTSFIPCTDQGQINQYISDIVDLFEADSRVYAYAYSDGYGLGNVWPTVSNGQLSASGQAYLNAISKYH